MAVNPTSKLAYALWRSRNPEIDMDIPDRVPPQLQVSARGLPRYAVDRLRIKGATLGRPPQPWITRDALQLLEELLQPSDRALEFGAGGTTQWLARRVEFIDSVEGFAQWHQPLATRLAEAQVTNVRLHLVDAGELGYQSDAHRDAYVNVQPDIEPGSLGLVFVDGEYRDDCALRALPLIKPGGLFVLDNAEVYLPSPSRSPWSVDRPATAKWGEFLRQVEGWRRIWTTNGVWDTAIWVKP